ncbi:thioester reductase domain-containing protein [Nocardiopsis terrae]
MTHSTEIAVVGVGARYPDAWTATEFWRNIAQGSVAMRELTDEQLRAAGVTEEEAARSDFVRVATSLPGVGEFAADFFGYTPREALTIDPQQRIFLETAWEALESAGHPPRPDGPVVGVFGSAYAGTYSAALLMARAREEGLRAAVEDLDLTVGGQPDFMTSRTADRLGLRGPALSVQTGCSASLYSLHYAVLSLLAGECDIALAGGATVQEPLRGYRYHEHGVVSRDGYCRSFDASSTGTTYSSGVGVVALRRLSDALADGDPVLAVVLGSAVGNDGGRGMGYVSPSPEGVADVVATALRVADTPADLLRYVEAHGTATAVGDTIELEALTRAARESTDKSGYCALGSVMSNIGHTGPAAGITGLIKAVDVARTGTLPPHPTFESPRDPELLRDSPFYVSTQRGEDTGPDRRVLVNSIGVGGTNAAVVLAPPPGPTRAPRPAATVERLVISARTRAELDSASQNLADVLDEGRVPVGDVSHTLRVGRGDFAERRVVEAGPGQLADALRVPRRPRARTTRTEQRRALLVLGGGDPVAAALLADSLPGAETVTGSLESVPEGTFAILVGHGESGADRHVVDTADGVAEGVEAALADAWLHGVRVDWEPLSSGAGRRVALPTYPFSRKRYWALDGAEPFRPWSGAAPVAGSTTPQGSVQEDLAEIWKEYLGVDEVGPDDGFGALGGTSLLSVQMVLEVQKRHGVLVNVHRAGGSSATIRRMAEIVETLKSGSAQGSSDVDPIADGDGDLVDRDLQLSLGGISTVRSRGRDALLTGATGYLGAFLLHELLTRTEGRVYALVRAVDEVEGMERLRATARKFSLPEPDPARVRPVPGDLGDLGSVLRGYSGGELAERVGHVYHCGARVVFTEPYRVLRPENVLSTLELIRWMRESGVRDISYVSTLAATRATEETGGTILEVREQDLAPDLGGYGVGKWVSERLLDRAEQDGMRVRVFRPGLIMSATTNGACNEKDLIWYVLIAALAVGAHPVDHRDIPVSPVDVLARGLVELSLNPGSAGRTYHLADREQTSMSGMFAMLEQAGMPTRPVTHEEWQRLVAERALADEENLLSLVAAFELEGHDAPGGLQAVAWRPWLTRRDLSAAVTSEHLRDGLIHLTRQDDLARRLLPGLAEEAR